MFKKLDLLRDWHKAGDKVPEKARLPGDPAELKSIIKAAVAKVDFKFRQIKREQKEEQEKSKTQEPAVGKDPAS